MLGLTATAKAIVSDKRSFGGRDGQVYQAQFQGFGFTAWAMTDRETNESLPPIGTEGEVTFSLEPQKDGSFKLAKPVFVPATATRTSKASV